MSYLITPHEYFHPFINNNTNTCCSSIETASIYVYTKAFYRFIAHDASIHANLIKDQSNCANCGNEYICAFFTIKFVVQKVFHLSAVCCEFICLKAIFRFCSISTEAIENKQWRFYHHTLTHSRQRQIVNPNTRSINAASYTHSTHSTTFILGADYTVLLRSHAHKNKTRRLTCYAECRPLAHTLCTCSCLYVYAFCSLFFLLLLVLNCISRDSLLFLFCLSLSLGSFKCQVSTQHRY